MVFSTVIRWRRALEHAWAETEVDEPDTLVLRDEDILETLPLLDERQPRRFEPPRRP